MSSYLNHSPAKVVAAILIAGSQCADPTVSPLGAWPVYDTGEPDRPDECVTLADTDGTLDGRDMVDGTINQHYGIQVRVRSKDKVTVWQEAQGLRAWLSERVYQAVVTVGTNTYAVQCLSKFSGVHSIGRDRPPTGRWNATFNCFVTVKELS